MLQQIKRRDKSGLSEMVGYVLLISLAVVMGGILYAWLSGWIPKAIPECPEGTSIMINSYDYNCTRNLLDLTISNNGRFDLAGFFIRASNKENQTIATVELSKYLNETSGAFIFRNSIVIGLGNNNSFVPNDEMRGVFDLVAVGRVYKIEITPARWQIENNKLRFLSCGASSTLKEAISCN